MAKRLFIIDAMAMAFRSFYAFGARPLTTSKGLPTSAVYGSAVFLNKLITEEKPDYLAVATDSQAKTFRHELYPAYKANRLEMPPDLSTQIPYLFELFAAMNIPLVKEPGLEADDLIGCLTKKYASKEMHIYIVSGDKDFMQLISPYVFLYAPKKGEDATIIDRDGVIAKFGCEPERVVDCLALIGDSSDNVPGVPGIGDKGASSLISKYGSLDGIYQHLDEIANKRQREGLAANRELAYLSQKLVTIKCDAEVESSLEDLQCDPDQALASTSLLEFYDKLEFRLLVTKTREAMERLGAPTPISAQGCLDTRQTDYILVQNAATLARLIDDLKAAKEFAFDTETTGLDVVTDRAIGLSFATRMGKAYYVPVAAQHLTDLTAAEIWTQLKPILEDETKTIIGHNLKFDLQMLLNESVNPKGPFIDTMILSYLIDSNSREHGLDASCLRELGYRKIPTTALMGEKKNRSMLDAPIDALCTYACEDADLTFELCQHLLPKIKDLDLKRVADRIEMPLVPVLAAMEHKGVFVDAEVLNEISHRLSDMAKILEARIYELAGEKFNINSTRQLQQIIFEKLKVHEAVGVTRIKKTKSGYSTDVSVLERLSDHPLPGSILEFRTVSKLKNTYVDTLPQLICPKTGRIHASFHQTGTATGRLSSSDPNLQNIPIRSDLGKEIRKAFRSNLPDYLILSADYSQIELRLLAHMAHEDNLAQAFRDGEDIHRSTAARIFGVPPDAVDGNMRASAKAINFGIIYGMGPTRLARETGVSMAEAKNFIERYFASYPRIKGYLDESLAFAREHGYSRTICGRRRPIVGLDSRDRMLAVNAENIAVNAPIQGSAADLIKLAMIKIHDHLGIENLRANMLLQVHDELVFECHKDDVETMQSLVKQNMESALQLDVPLVVDIGVGQNWLEAH